MRLLIGTMLLPVGYHNFDNHARIMRMLEIPNLCFTTTHPQQSRVRELSRVNRDDDPIHK